MNQDMNNQNDEPLRSVLREWRVESPLPPRFQEQVWNRIEREEANVPLALWPLILAWFKSSVARPAFAVAYASVLLMAGLTAGFVHAQQENAKLNSAIEARYVQSIDPYQK
jgi:hypothetical protein